MKDTIFAVTMGLQGCAVICLIVSILYPDRRIWPPREFRSWRTFLMATLFLGSAAGIFMLGILDWTPPEADTVSSVRIVLGIVFWGAGFALSIFAMGWLGVRSTAGDNGSFCRRGPFSVTRNPQYLGFIFLLIGWHLLIVSIEVLIAVILAGCIFWLLPFAEEPFLRLRFGLEYEEYCREVPRWLWR